MCFHPFQSSSRRSGEWSTSMETTCRALANQKASVPPFGTPDLQDWASGAIALDRLKANRDLELVLDDIHEARLLRTRAQRRLPETRTSVFQSPRILKSPVTSTQRGCAAATKSSRIRLVTSSWKAPFLPVRPQVELQRLQLDEELVGHVADPDGGEVRLAGHRTHARELVRDHRDFVVPVGMRIGDGREGLRRRRRHPWNYSNVLCRHRRGCGASPGARAGVVRLMPMATAAQAAEIGGRGPCGGCDGAEDRLGQEEGRECARAIAREQPQVRDEVEARNHAPPDSRSRRRGATSSASRLVLQRRIMKCASTTVCTA